MIRKSIIKILIIIIIILLRAGAREFPILENFTHSHSRTRHSQNKGSTTPNR